jgi:2-polyprenyl-6-methoxyphenol hydroxylase-like FAD-dependent oxidoreductase
VIVGAGPTGLALACELFRRDVPCRVVESATARSDRSKAIAVWPRVLEILAGIGVAEDAVRRGIRLDEGTIWSGGRPVVRFSLRGLASRYDFALVLPQYETEALLAERLAQLGGHVEQGVTCEGVRVEATSAVLALRQGARVEHVNAGWVIGCDGSGSVVRRGAGFRMRERLEIEGWIGADVHLDTELKPTGVNYFLTRGKVLHVVPLRDRSGVEIWRITMNVGRVSPRPVDWPVERLSSTAAERCAVPMRVTGAEWVTGFRVRQGVVDTFRRGPVLLAGDAAHVHSPAGAQGINSGLQDAVNLGWKLARVWRGESPVELLDTYDAERRPMARSVVRATDRASRMGTLRSPLAIAARDGLWSLAGRRGLIDRRLVPALAGFAQRYRATPVSPGRRSRLAGAVRPAPPGPGARLPNVALEVGWLWDRLPADGFAVVLVSTNGEPVPTDVVPPGVPALVFGDLDPRIPAALGITEPTALVIRPDRYIGLRAPAGDARALGDYFRSASLGSAPGRPADTQPMGR